MNKKRGLRHYDIATVGVLGGVVASYLGTAFDWRVAYIIGGRDGAVDCWCLRIRRQRSRASFHSVQQRDGQSRQLPAPVHRRQGTGEESLTLSSSACRSGVRVAIFITLCA
jgi:hypothetical protein